MVEDLPGLRSNRAIDLVCNVVSDRIDLASWVEGFASSRSSRLSLGVRGCRIAILICIMVDAFACVRVHPPFLLGRMGFRQSLNLASWVDSIACGRVLRAISLGGVVSKDRLI